MGSQERELNKEETPSAKDTELSESISNAMPRNLKLSLKETGVMEDLQTGVMWSHLHFQVITYMVLQNLNLGMHQNHLETFQIA